MEKSTPGVLKETTSVSMDKQIRDLNVTFGEKCKYFYQGDQEVMARLPLGHSNVDIGILLYG